MEQDSDNWYQGVISVAFSGSVIVVQCQTMILPMNVIDALFMWNYLNMLHKKVQNSKVNT
jgi:hypothetical protein